MKSLTIFKAFSGVGAVVAAGAGAVVVSVPAASRETSGGTGGPAAGAGAGVANGNVNGKDKTGPLQTTPGDEAGSQSGSTANDSKRDAYTVVDSGKALNTVHADKSVPSQGVTVIPDIPAVKTAAVKAPGAGVANLNLDASTTGANSSSSDPGSIDSSSNGGDAPSSSVQHADSLVSVPRVSQEVGDADKKTDNLQTPPVDKATPAGSQSGSTVNDGKQDTGTAGDSSTVNTPPANEGQTSSLVSEGASGDGDDLGGNSEVVYVTDESSQTNAKSEDDVQSE